MAADPRSGHGTLYPERLPVFHRAPAEGDAAHVAAWFWTSEWDLQPGQVSRQELLAFPGCNLVVEPHVVGVSGPTTRASHRDLAGRGWAVAALLRPAAVPAVLPAATGGPSRLRDRYVEVDAGDAGPLVRAAMADGDRHAAVAHLASRLVATVGEVTAEGHLANRLAQVIADDPGVLTVADVAERLGVSERTVHRIAARYVGLPPASMIRRRRLQDAAARVRAEPTLDLATLAAELGYADQAHLTRDFRTVLGITPGAYRAHRREVQEPRQS